MYILLHIKQAKIAKQQSKIQIKWKIDQLNPQKIMLKVNIYIVSHAKNQSHWPKGSMEK